MIEGFSVWLTPRVEHDLVAYNNPEKERSYIYCSCHGPDREKVVTVAEKIFQLQPNNIAAGWDDEEYYIQNWLLGALEESGFFLVFRKDRVLTEAESELISDALEVLREPLQRALDYEDLFAASRKDPLTGLDNRRVFEEQIGPMLDNAKRHNYPLSIISMDLDEWKKHGISEDFAKNQQRVVDAFEKMGVKDRARDEWNMALELAEDDEQKEAVMNRLKD